MPKYLRVGDYNVRRIPGGDTCAPKQLKKQIGAEQLIHAMRFSHRLRNTEEFEDALIDASDYLSDLSGLPATTSEEDLKSLDNPSARTIHRSYLRLDAVSMNLERREWQHYYEKDLVHSINLFVDGSPVSGHN